MSGGPFIDRQALGRRRVGAAVAGGLLLLALVETAAALIAPLRAPSDADWAAAAASVRRGFRPGDLIVAAPAWSDPVMRLHLGDLVPVPAATRLDSGRFARIWEIAQRGAASDETAGAALAGQSRHGALRVRLWERRPAPVLTYDFVAEWSRARVVRLEPGRGEIACERQLDRHQCPLIGFNWVKPHLLEIGTTMRQALYAQPVGGATVVVEYPAVPLGRELAIGHGLHHVWLRKGGDGTVRLRVLIDGQEAAVEQASNRSGWRVRRIDTAALEGRKATVRFEISSERPFSRHFGFAAEARR